MAELETRGFRLPTIVLSGLDQASTVVKAMRLGALDYLVKPLEESDLELAIEKALDDHEDGAGYELNDGDTEFSSSNKRMAQIQAISTKWHTPMFRFSSWASPVLEKMFWRVISIKGLAEQVLLSG